MMTTGIADVGLNPGLDAARRAYALRVGMWIFLATVTMMFGAFGSAYIVRGAGADWSPVALPIAVWINTAVLLLSSVSLELSRARRRAGSWRAARDWWLITALLGTAFLFGQLGVWRQLSASGVTLPTSSYGAFVYVLTGAHAVHLVAGLVLLTVVAIREAQHWSEVTPEERHEGPSLGMELGATFWHFLTALWAYLLVLLTVFR